MPVFLLGSCTKYDEPAPSPEGGEDFIEALFSVRVPGARTPATRAMTEFNEAHLKTVDIVVFEKSGSNEILSEHYIVNASEITQPDNKADKYEAVFPVRLKANVNATTVAVVANASQSLAEAVATGKTKEAFLEELCFASTNTSDNYKWDTSSSYMPIPMYGEAVLSTGGLTSSTELKNISLIRMLAAVDIFNNAAGFTITSVSVANYYTAGNIAPAWDRTSGKLLASLPENPIPCQAGFKWGTTESSVMNYPGDITPGGSLEREIYLYESDKASGGDADESRIGATCLIIKGKIAGDAKEYYYRIDFTDCKDASDLEPGDPGYDPSTVDYMPIYRNHRYIVDIQKAEGRGYDTFGEALQSLSVISNLKTTLHVVDETMDYVVFNGQYYLGVEKQTISHPWWEDIDYAVTIKTNYPGGWKAEVENPSDKRWLRLGNEATSYTATYADVALPIRFIPLSMRSDPELMGEISITAGRLSLTLKVEKRSIAEIYAKSNVVMLDEGMPREKLTFATSQAENSAIPSNVQGLHFKFGSLLGINCDAEAVRQTNFNISHVVFIPEEFTGNASNYTLTRWYNFMAHDVYDEFISVYQGKGYDEENGHGDICRYISDKGWVDGDWRLPTSLELRYLFNTSTVRTPATAPWNFEAVTNLPGTWGTSPFENGAWFGAVASSDKQSPPESTVFLPASGYRGPISTGNLMHPGTGGYYWSCTAWVDGEGTGNAQNAHYLYFYSDLEAPMGSGQTSNFRALGKSVRCIQNYNKEMN